MARIVFCMMSAAVVLSAFLTSAEAGANTLNIQVRPHLPTLTTLHVEVKPRLYRDIVLVESCGNVPRRNDHGVSARKRCRLDD